MPAPWGCVLVTRTERSLGPTALNHTPPPTHCHGRQSRLVQKIPGERPLVKSTGLHQVAYITSFYSNWYGDIWCCYDTSPAFESTPMSEWLYTEWMIPPKCILEFCTNTFSELSKQCRPLSRCIVYAFCAVWLSECVREQQREREREREREKDKEGERERGREGERERGRERGRQPPSPGDISSVYGTGRFSILSAFFFTCRTDS